MHQTGPTAELNEGFSEPGAAATPWAEVAEALSESEMFWLSTMRRDGRPHSTPLPAIWLDGTLYFCAGSHEQKTKNLEANPRCVLAAGANQFRSGLDVVVEGTAVRETGPAQLQRLAARDSAILLAGTGSCSASHQPRSSHSARTPTARPDTASSPDPPGWPLGPKPQLLHTRPNLGRGALRREQEARTTDETDPEWLGTRPTGGCHLRRLEADGPRLHRRGQPVREHPAAAAAGPVLLRRLPTRLLASRYCGAGRRSVPPLCGW